MAAALLREQLNVSNSRRGVIAAGRRLCCQQHEQVFAGHEFGMGKGMNWATRAHLNNVSTGAKE